MSDNIRILVVDDEPNVLEAFKISLKMKLYETDVFRDAAEAIKAVEKDKYTMAFVDLKLPRIDGLEVMKRLKKKDPKIEVIIVTAYATDHSHSNAIKLGALEYLRKPFLMEEIYELVDRAIKKRSSKKESNKKNSVQSLSED